MLDGLAVLDLTDDRGEIGPWILSELGADVIKVEPPGGTHARRAAPLFEGESLQFAVYNSGKRSITLDPASADDRTTLRELLSQTRIVVESGPPGPLVGYGIDRRKLLDLNPTVVSVLITPFGSDGPRADQPATDLTIAALGGQVRLQGTPDRPPVRISVPQVWRHAGAEAAIAALVAMARSDGLGRPQFVDVSAQSVMTWTMLNAMEASAIQGHDFERTGATLRLAMTVPLRRPCADGYVVLLPGGPNIAKMLHWLIEDGIVDQSWAEEDWLSFDGRVIDGEPTAFSHQEVIDALDRLCSKYTKRRLLEKGSELGVSIAPINNVTDLRSFDHLDARSFWRTLDIDPSGSGIGLFGESEDDVRLPGAFVTIDGDRPAEPRKLCCPAATPPAFRIAERASESRVHARSASAVRSGSDISDAELPFSGLKVADFSWVGVGPITAKSLADHGATVVRVESSNRPDVLRSQVPFKDGVPGLDRSAFFGAFNTSKQSLSIDLKNEGGLRVARKLVNWADVVIDSFTPGAMARLGLGPEEIRKTNPSVITVTTSLLGGGGPFSSMAGYGYHAAAIAGFFDLVGWADAPPDGPWLAYTDTIGPRLISSTIMAALDRRRRTGEGCHIEAAQLEMALQFLAPELLHYELDGAVASRNGNRSSSYAPQGIYPCKGEDCWIALSVTDADTWARFRDVLGNPPWAMGAVLDSVEGRRANHDAVDAGIAAWTSEHTEDEVERLLREAGVAVGVPQRSSDLLQDPQYQHRAFYRVLDHAEMGPVPYAGHQHKIEGYDNGPRWAAPVLGQHTFDVLTELLGYDVDEIAEIAATGCLE